MIPGLDRESAKHKINCRNYDLKDKYIFLTKGEFELYTKMLQKMKRNLKYIVYSLFTLGLIILINNQLIQLNCKLTVQGINGGVAGGLTILGTSMLSMAICLKIFCQKDGGIKYLIGIAYLFAVWFYLRSDAIIAMNGNVLLLRIIKMTCMLLVPSIVILFFDEYQKYRFHKTYMIFFVLPIIDWIICLGIYLLQRNYWYEICLSNHIIFLTVICVCIYHLAKEIIQYKRKLTELILAFTFLMLIIGILEIIYVYNRKIQQFNTAFGIQIILYILSIFICVTIDVIRTNIAQKEEKEKKIKRHLIKFIDREYRRGTEKILENNAEILEQCIEENVFQKAMLINRESFSLEQVTQNVIEYIQLVDQKEDFKNEKIEITKLLNMLIGITAEQAEEKNIELQVEVDDKFPQTIYAPAYCVEKLIKSILWYALRNSLKGIITYKMQGELVKTDEFQVVITMEDEGKVYSCEELKELQSIFESMSIERLGDLVDINYDLQPIAIYAKVLKADLKVENEEKEGSRVIVSFPCEVKAMEPIGEFQNWYQVKETQYNKFRRRIFKKQQEEREKEAQASLKRTENPVDAKTILLEGDIQVDDALKYVGSDWNQYVTIAKMFPEQIAEKQFLVQKYYEEKDYANYMIQVHALKNNARMLGANKLAELSLAHEKASSSKQEDFITQNYAELLREWNRINQVFVRFLAAECKEKKEEKRQEVLLLDKGQWTEKLEAISTELDNYHKKEALKLLQELEEYILSEEQKNSVLVLKDYIQKFDYENAIEYIQSIEK